MSQAIQKILVQDKLQVPIQISSFVQKNGLVKPFAVYLYLKFVSSGKLHQSSAAFQLLPKAVGIKSAKTVNKYLKILQDLNWIGYNTCSGYYFIRSFGYIRYVNNFRNRQATTLLYKNLKKMQAFVVGSILAAKANGKKYYWEVAEKRMVRAAVNKRGAAYHFSPAANQPQPNYYGICLYEISDLLNCKKTRASQLKQLAAKEGFIKVKHRYEMYTKLQENDSRLKPFLEDMSPALKGRIRFKKVTEKKVKMVIVSIQTVDEIIPALSFKTITKFCNLKISPAVIYNYEKQQADKVA